LAEVARKLASILFDVAYEALDAIANARRELDREPAVFESLKIGRR
jgi:hypothetical protein